MLALVSTGQPIGKLYEGKGKLAKHIVEAAVVGRAAPLTWSWVPPPSTSNPPPRPSHSPLPPHVAHNAVAFFRA
jgi:hypothetical protein